MRKYCLTITTFSILLPIIFEYSQMHLFLSIYHTLKVFTTELFKKKVKYIYFRRLEWKDVIFTLENVSIDMYRALGNKNYSQKIIIFHRLLHLHLFIMYTYIQIFSYDKFIKTTLNPKRIWRKLKFNKYSYQLLFNYCSIIHWNFIRNTRLSIM